MGAVVEALEGARVGTLVRAVEGTSAEVVNGWSDGWITSPSTGPSDVSTASAAVMRRRRRIGDSMEVFTIHSCRAVRLRIRESEEVHWQEPPDHRGLLEVSEQCPGEL